MNISSKTHKVCIYYNDNIIETLSDNKFPTDVKSYQECLLHSMMIIFHYIIKNCDYLDFLSLPSNFSNIKYNLINKTDNDTIAFFGKIRSPNTIERKYFHVSITKRIFNIE